MLSKANLLERPNRAVWRRSQQSSRCALGPCGSLSPFPAFRFRCGPSVSAGNDMRFVPEQTEKTGILRQKRPALTNNFLKSATFKTGGFGFFLVQPNVRPKYAALGVFNFYSCSCCSRRTPRIGCVFANATFTGGRATATARSHENRRRGVVLFCRVRWHMRGGMRVPYNARTPQQRKQQSHFGHWR